MPIARVALPVAVATTFDYWIPQGLSIARGAIVRVALGPRRLAGIVVEIASESEVDRAKLAPVIDVIGGESVPDDVLDLCAFVSAYYRYEARMARHDADKPWTRHAARRVSP